jgi:hypothetical protein
MTDALPTFRNGLLSIFQSASDEYARRKSGAAVLADATSAAAQGVAVKVVTARTETKLRSEVDNCADLGLRYLEAKVRGDGAAAQAIWKSIAFSKCDPQWAEVLAEHAKYFGSAGGITPVPYIRAGTIWPHVLDLKPDARVALIADWGTGTDAAIEIMRAVAQRLPDAVIHLGDVYYSGTQSECGAFFLDVVNDALDRKSSAVPVYAIPGNHDMYSAGSGFYDLIGKLNGGVQQQPASFFCLRAPGWQFIAMDTGLHDSDPLHVSETLTFLEKDEEDWHVARIAEFSGRTVLLSHHQLFSAFSPIGKPDADGNLHPCNPNLLESYGRFKGAGDIAAWFWGHEHNLCVFKPYAGLERGRCIGHGAIPVFASDAPYKNPDALLDPPQLTAGTQLPMTGDIYAHGYVIATLRGASATFDYYAGTDDKPFYSEIV